MATIDKITLIEGTGDAQTTNTYDIVDNTAATAIEGLQTITTSLSNELTTVKNEVAGLDTSLEATITTVSGISTDLTDTKGTVQTLSTELTTVKNEVAGLDTSLDMSNTEVSNINSDLTALTNKVNAIPTVAIQYQDNTNTLAFRTNTVGGTPHTPVTPFADNSIEAISVDGSTYNISASATNYCKLIYSTASNASTIAANTTIIDTTSQGYGLLNPTYNTALAIVENVKLDKPFKNLAQVRNSLAYITQGNIISIGCMVTLTNSTTTSYSSPLIFHAQPIVTIPTLQPDNVTIVVQARVYLTLLSGLRIPSQGADVVIKNAAPINLNSFNIHAQLIMQY